MPTKRSKEELAIERSHCEAFLKEMERLEAFPENESFTVAPRLRTAFLVAAARLKREIDARAAGGRRGGTNVTDKKREHLTSIAKLERPRARKNKNS